MKSGEGIEIIARGACVKDGKLLVCHTKGKSNTYLPGGHIEFGEEARASLCREIREELGISAEAGRFLGVVEHEYVQNGQRCCEINLVFKIDIPLNACDTPASQEDYIEFWWEDMDSLMDSRLEPAPLRVLLGCWIDSKENVERWGSSY